MAYGGPLVDPDMDAVVLKAVGAQVGLQCPLVFSLEHHFSIECGQSAMVICDGKETAVLPAYSRLSITRSKYMAKFVTFDVKTSVCRIQEKLFQLNHKMFSNDKTDEDF